jgi:hypothetical protein
MLNPAVLMILPRARSIFEAAWHSGDFGATIKVAPVPAVTLQRHDFRGV